MAVKLIGNIDNKIIKTNSSGKNIKQTFNLGNGFVGKETTQKSIEFNFNNPIQLPISVMIWRDGNVASSNGNNSVIKLIFSDESENLIDWRTSSTLTAQNENRINVTGFTNTNNVWCFYGAALIVFDNINGSLLRSAYNLNPSQVSSELLSVSYGTKTSIKKIVIDSSRYTLSTLYRLNRFALWNYPVPANEFKYIWSNGSGNELYRGIEDDPDLVVYSDLNYAEELSCEDGLGGSELLPAVRNVKGNNHGQITNLPAGTNQEKIDYANANLFKQFKYQL